jgi:UDP:flavonoid glycosyltransferase YjiC (YdhE family)
MLPLEKYKNHPSLTSTVIPGETLGNRIAVCVSWKKYYFMQSLYTIREKFLYSGILYKSISRKLMASAKLRGVALDFERNFYFSVKNIPELILSPIDLDFPKQLKPHQHYIGPLTEKRTDDIYDFNFTRTIAEIKQRAIRSKAPVIYCSLGSRNIVQYKGCQKFLQRVIDALQNISCELIIAAGDSLDRDSFTIRTDNVHIFQTVPQCMLLQYANMMITHGGMQSITECILHEVPVLVYPLSSRWDQPGNAARVAFHRIGLRGNIRKETTLALRDKVLQLLSNPEFNNNVRLMKQKISTRHESVDIDGIFSTFLPAPISSLHKSLQEL